MEKTEIYQIPVRCRGVAAILLKKFGANYKVLLLKRALYLEDAWCYVAGKIEKGEKAWQTALREIKEETGLVPAKLYSANICEQFYEVNLDSIWLAPVFVGYIRETDEALLNFEHKEFGWFDFAEAMHKVTFPSQRDILRYVEREFSDNKVTEYLRIEI